MLYLLMFFVGLGGGIAVGLALAEAKRRENRHQGERLRAEQERIRQAARELSEKKAELSDAKNEWIAEAERREAAELARLQGLAKEITFQSARLQEHKASFAEAQAVFERQTISYRELQNENRLLRRDLLALHVERQKVRLDLARQQERQEALNDKCNELGLKYLKEGTKEALKSIKPDNYVNNKERLQKVIQWVRDIGVPVSNSEAADLHATLKHGFELKVRAEAERERQAREKARLREEARREREIIEEQARLKSEEDAIREALEKALADAREQHTAEIDKLRAQLAEAEEKSRRAVAQAQLTKVGHVYVISNIGSFGTNVFKVGLTRRLEPEDRIKELGDASVPFPFDVHMMIYSEDAPSLETQLHHALHRLRVNRINPRKEFFRTDLDAIRRVVEEHHGVVEYVADAEALEYHQSQSMSDEDFEFIEETFEKEGLTADDEADAVGD